MEIILSNGEKRSLQEAIRDDLYGMYLHADNEKIENLLKTNMTTYLFAANKYVSFWEELLTESYHLVEKLVTDKYKREPFDKATVVFVGDDKTQAQDIHSASYWSNLRGRDASSEEIKTMFEQLTDEERGILLLAQLFILELQNDNYSVDVLKEMIHPVVKPYWGDFSTAHEMLAGVEIGYSNKIRFNEDRDIAYVLLFRHFDPNGLFIINQPQYSDDILALYLKKENKRKGWKIVSINDSPDQIIKTVNIKPIKALKKMIKNRVSKNE